MKNYNPNYENQINNSNQNLNNVGLNNYQRQIYDNQNNILLNKGIQQNYSFPNNDEMKNSQQIKKFQNQSQTEPNNISNPSINLGNMINLNYNGTNNIFTKNHNNNMNNKIFLISQNENINVMSNQSQKIPNLINMNFNPLNNRNFYIPQNMRNSLMNNNYINNNHINGLNNINNKDFYNNGYTLFICAIQTIHIKILIFF